MDRLDLDEVLAVGQGFGASVVQALAAALPDRVALTVGVGPSTHLPHIDPAVALLTSGGADAVAAQILPFLN